MLTTSPLSTLLPISPSYRRYQITISTVTNVTFTPLLPTSPLSTLLPISPSYRRYQITFNTVTNVRFIPLLPTSQLLPLLPNLPFTIVTTYNASYAQPSQCLWSLQSYSSVQAVSRFVSYLIYGQFFTATCSNQHSHSNVWRVMVTTLRPSFTFLSPCNYYSLHRKKTPWWRIRAGVSTAAWS
jgi:hypothetical protein